MTFLRVAHAMQGVPNREEKTNTFKANIKFQI